MKAHNALFYPSYEEVLKMKKRCLPKNAPIEKGLGFLQIGLQGVLDHQLDYLLTESRISKIKELACQPQFVIVLWSKFGADSATGLPQYNTMDNLNHESFFTSYLTPVAIQAVHNACKKKSITIYLNEMANSPFGQIYVRTALEKETQGTVITLYIHTLDSKFKCMSVDTDAVALFSKKYLTLSLSSST